VIDERKLKSIKRVSQVIAALSITAFFALIGYSAYKLYSINRETAEATEKLNVVKKEAERLEADIEKKRNEIAGLDKKIEALNEVNSKISIMNPQLVRQAIKEVIESSPKAAGALPRIYVHIKDETQRARAKQIVRKLQEDKFIVPGIENVGEKASGNTVLKYFHKNDQETADAKQIIELLQSEKIVATAQYTPGFEDSNIVRPRHYELWLGADFSPPRPKDVQQKAVQQKGIKRK
jgi:chromosome segregation ATPase